MDIGSAKFAPFLDAKKVAQETKEHGAPEGLKLGN
jgi:hypothetical protein